MHAFVRSPLARFFENASLTDIRTYNSFPQVALIGISLSSDAELGWVNSYHATVLQKLGTLLANQGRTAARAWLEKNTHPLRYYYPATTV